MSVFEFDVATHLVFFSQNNLKVYEESDHAVSHLQVVVRYLPHAGFIF